MMTLAFLLKATVILCAGLCATVIARRSRAAIRHVVLAATFAMLFLLPVTIAILPSLAVTVPAALQTTLTPITEASPIEAIDASSMPAAAQVSVGARERQWNWPTLPQVLSSVWIAGAGAFLLPVAVGLWRVRRLRQSALPWRRGEAVLAELRGGTHARRAVTVLLHEALAGPMTCGIFRHAIVLPVDASAWSRADLDRALVHELEHVRRLDWLTQCGARIVAAAYWFHPIVWMAWRRFALEAERACDDAVLCHPRNPAAEVDDAAYADQLVHLAQRLAAGSRQAHLAMANRRDLSARIRAVLDSRQPRGRAGHTAILGAALLAAVAVALVSPLQLVAGSLDPQAGAAQSPRARFEVASIKPCLDDATPPAGTGRQGGAGQQTGSPDRVVLPCITIDRLIAIAYVTNGEPLLNNLPTSPVDGRFDWIKGLPDWALKEKFTVEGKAPEPADVKTLRGSMLAALLEERFKLKLHRDTEEAAVYALTVAKGGLKIAPEPCTPLTGTTEPPQAAYTERVLKGGKPNCATFTMALGTTPGTRRWVIGGETMAKFAGVLSGALDRRVIDRTGLTDEYTIRLQFLPDEHNRGRSVLEAGGNVPPDASGPNMFAALEAQLGLKLEPTRAPRGVIVVDSIQRPVPDEAAARAVGVGSRRLGATSGR